MLDRRIHSERNGGIETRFFHKYVPPFERLPKLHCHPEYEIAIFLEGRGLYTVGGRQYPIVPGDAFLFTSYEPHYITRIDVGYAMHTVNLQFSRSLLCSDDDTLDDDYLRFFVDRNAAFSNRLTAEHPFSQPLYQAMLDFERIFSLPQDGEVLLALKPRLSAVLNDLRIACGLPLTPQTPGLASKLRPAYEYVDRHLTQPISLDDLAQSVSMSRSYFSSTFRRLSGLSPWEYIQAKRVRHAITLISEGKRSMLDIALDSGFNNSANFNRAFRKITGTTPKSYRP